MSYSFKLARERQLVVETFRLRHDVFVTEKHWLESTNDAYDYDYHDIFSQHLAAVGAHGEVVGCARLVHNTTLFGLPFDKVQAMPDHLDKDRMFEVSRLATRLTDRGQRSVVLLGLTRLACRIGLARDYTHWCAVVDVPVARLLKMLGLTFELESEPVFYLGSQSVPLVCTMHAAYEVLFTDKIDSLLAGQIEEAYRE